MNQDDDLRFVREMTWAARKAPLLGRCYPVFSGSILPLAERFRWAVLSAAAARTSILPPGIVLQRQDPESV